MTKTSIPWEIGGGDRERGTYEDLITPAMVACPEAVMIRDFSTSAGEQTAICQLASDFTISMDQ